ncbi:aldehyde dehydrogenase family protein [Ascidiaceihabitans sp.]|nr:aldehyde dehydrogenase family protein [Ascidiaceihabitans sp.]
MAPTLVKCDSHEIETLDIGLFGFIMSLIPSDTEEEARTLANSTTFGLGSGVFTQNLARAHRVSARLKARICCVNTYRAVSPIAPFFGVGTITLGMGERQVSLRSTITPARKPRGSTR